MKEKQKDKEDAAKEIGAQIHAKEKQIKHDKADQKDLNTKLY